MQKLKTAFLFLSKLSFHVISQSNSQCKNRYSDFRYCHTPDCMLPFSQLDELIMTVLHSLQCKISMASSNYPQQQFILSKGRNYGCNQKIIFGDVRWIGNLTSNAAVGTGRTDPLKGMASHQHSSRYTTQFVFLNRHLSKC